MTAATETSALPAVGRALTRNFFLAALILTAAPLFGVARADAQIPGCPAPASGQVGLCKAAFNTGNPVPVGRRGADARLYEHAASFVTGANANGYLLQRANIHFQGIGGTTPGDLQVSIHAHASGDPGTLVGVLSGDNPGSSAAWVGFTSEAGIPLRSATRYWLVLSAPSVATTVAEATRNSHYRVTLTGGSATSADGWTTAANGRTRTSSGGWQRRTDSRSLLFGLIATTAMATPAPNRVAAVGSPNGITAWWEPGETSTDPARTPSGYEVCAVPATPGFVFDATRCTAERITAATPQEITTTNTITVTGLDYDSFYRVAVRATHPRGDSDWVLMDRHVRPGSGPMLTIAAENSPFTEGSEDGAELLQFSVTPSRVFLEPQQVTVTISSDTPEALDAYLQYYVAPAYDRDFSESSLCTSVRGEDDCVATDGTEESDDDLRRLVLTMPKGSTAPVVFGFHIGDDLVDNGGVTVTATLSPYDTSDFLESLVDPPQHEDGTESDAPFVFPSSIVPKTAFTLAGDGTATAEILDNDGGFVPLPDLPFETGQERVCALVRDSGTGVRPVDVANVGSQVIAQGSSAWRQAVPIHTGDNRGDYILRTANFMFAESTGSPGQPQLAVYTDDGGSPGTQVGLFSFAAAAHPSSGARTFIATDDGIALERDTNYWLVLSAPSATSGNNHHSLVVYETTTQASAGWDASGAPGQQALGESAWSPFTPSNAHIPFCAVADALTHPTLTLTAVQDVVLEGETRTTAVNVSVDPDVAFSVEQEVVVVVTGVTGSDDTDVDDYFDAPSVRTQTVTFAAENPLPQFVSFPLAINVENHGGATLSVDVAASDAYASAGAVTVQIYDDDVFCPAAVPPQETVCNFEVADAGITLPVGVVHESGSSTERQASGVFRTGAHSAGYTLDSVSALFHSNMGDSAGDITVAIHANNAARPGTLIGTLRGANPSGGDGTFRAGGDGTFRETSSITLSANTLYHVVFSAPSAATGANNHYRLLTAVSPREPTASAGWEIEDFCTRKQGSAAFTIAGCNWSAALAVLATPVPPTLTLAATNTPLLEAEGAALTFSVTPSAGFTTPQVVTVELASSPAEDLADYVPTADRRQSVTIPAGSTAAAFVSFPVTNDDTHEGGANVTATILPRRTAFVVAGPASARIADDDLLLGTPSGGCPVPSGNQALVCKREDIEGGADVTVVPVGRIAEGQSGAGLHAQAASFTTGGNTLGYTLKRLAVPFVGAVRIDSVEDSAGHLDASDVLPATLGTPGNVQVAIHANSSGNPGDRLALLSGGSPSTGGWFAFSTTGVALTASTTYWIVLSTPDAPSSGDHAYHVSIARQRVARTQGWEAGATGRVQTDASAWAQNVGTRSFAFGLVADILAAPPPEPSMPQLTIAALNSPATESDGAHIAFRITPSVAFTVPQAITVTLRSEPPLALNRYVPAASDRTRSVIFPHDTTDFVAVYFPVTNDAVDNGDVAVNATITPSDAFTLASGGVATAMIVDNDIVTRPPTSVTATPGDGQITVAWAAPTARRVPTGYEFCVYEQSDDIAFSGASCGGSAVTTATATQITAGTATLTGLENDTPHWVAVRGTHEDGNSAWMPVPARVTPGTSPPTGVTATPGDGEITVAWTAPTQPRVPTGYELCVYEQRTAAAFDGARCTSPFTATASQITAGSATLASLNNGTPHWVAVRGTHDDGNSAWVPAAERVTPSAAPVTPARIVVNPSSVTVSEDGTTATYVLTLSQQPQGSGNVRVDVVGTAGIATASSTELVFAAGGNRWMQGYTVTVTGVDDSINNPNDRRTGVITHTLRNETTPTDPAYESVAAVTVSVTVTDDDDATTGLRSAHRVTASTTASSLTVMWELATASGDTNPGRWQSCIIPTTDATGFVNAVSTAGLANCIGTGTEGGASARSLTRTAGLIQGTAYRVAVRGVTSDYSANTDWVEATGGPFMLQAAVDCPSTSGAQESACNLDVVASALSFVNIDAGNPRSAQRFTTGGTTTDTYTVNSVRIRVNANTSGTLTLQIQEAAQDGTPGSVVAGTLTAPAGGTATAGLYDFAATGVTLTGGTHYFLRPMATGALVQIAATRIGSETSSSGWSILDNRAYASSDGTSWNLAALNPLMFAIVATPAGAAPPPPSSDATLSALMLSNVDFGTFASATTSYTATVENSVSSTTVTATPTDAGARVTEIAVGGRAVSGTSVNLAEGANAITVTVTAEDGSEGVYTVTVTRRPSAPSAPQGFTVAPRPTQLILTWSAPSTGGAPDSYDVCQLTDMAVSDTNCTGAALVAEGLAGSATTYTISGLTDGTTYNVGVRAENSIGTGAWASASGTPNLPALNVMAERASYRVGDDEIVFVVTTDQPATAPTPLTVELRGADAFVAEDEPTTQTVTLPMDETMVEVSFRLADEADPDAANASATVVITIPAGYQNAGQPVESPSVEIVNAVPEEVLVEVGTTVVGSLDLAGARLATGAIARRFSAAPAASVGSKLASLGERLHAAARADVSDADSSADVVGLGQTTGLAATGADWRAASSAHTQAAPAPGSIESRYPADDWRTLDGDALSHMARSRLSALNLGLGGGFGLWTTASRADLSGDIGGGQNTDYDGDNSIWQVGLDRRSADGALLVGLSVGWSTGEADFTQRATGATTAVSGTVERSGVTFYPYLSWRKGAASSLWVLGGYGSGDYELAIEGDREETDATQWLLAGGAETTLRQNKLYTLGVRASGLWSRSEVDAGALVPAFDAALWQAQGEVELASNGASAVRPYLLGALRYHGGDGLRTDAAFDIGGGLRANIRESGLQLDLGGRAQIQKLKNRREHVFYGSLRYDRGGDRRGFTASLTQGMSQVLRSDWRAGVFDDGRDAALLGAQGLQARFGYGWGARLGERAGVLTAFAEMRHATPSVGLAFEARRFLLSLETRDLQEEPRTELRLRMGF